MAPSTALRGNIAPLCSGSSISSNLNRGIMGAFPRRGFCQQSVGRTRRHQQLQLWPHPASTIPQVLRVSARARGQEASKGRQTEKEAPLETSASEPLSTVGNVRVDPAIQSGYIGSPLLWIGVGVGITYVFRWAANSFKKYAMQQMFKTMSSQAMPGGSPFGAGAGGNPFGGGMPPMSPGFPFPPIPSQTAPRTPVMAAAPTVETVASTPSQPSSNSGATTVTTEVPKAEFKFTDVNASLVEEQQEAAARAAEQATKPQDEPARSYFSDPEVVAEVFRASSDGGANSTFDGKSKNLFSVEALERMMEDPTVQKMVYPYLPEEMRNPATFKWMMQNPQYRQQLQDMLNSMGGDGAWDNRMSDMLKNFDLNSQEVKQQFDQIGLTPEEVVAKIMANPEVAVAFQNPKVQAAIMDCSQNPLNITKYQNDKEVMDVFNKISELFPGMTGSAY
ncbi:unnamed protein product [Calypogeia fissa]